MAPLLVKPQFWIFWLVFSGGVRAVMLIGGRSWRLVA
jgi:hypothetical protein